MSTYVQFYLYSHYKDHIFEFMWRYRAEIHSASVHFLVSRMSSSSILNYWISVNLNKGVTNNKLHDLLTHIFLESCQAHTTKLILKWSIWMGLSIQTECLFRYKLVCSTVSTCLQQNVLSPSSYPTHHLLFQAAQTNIKLSTKSRSLPMPAAILDTWC